MRIKPLNRICFLIIGSLLLSIQNAHAELLRVAVASNFKGAMQSLISRFEDDTGHRVLMSVAATGKHYAQIRNGAPFDLFLAADVERPRKLEELGMTLGEPRFTYAIGRLVLWSTQAELIDQQARVLQTGSFNYLAIANPRLAPYGIAARQVLQQLGVWEQLDGRLVRGENIAQTYQFVGSGNADLGFIAAAQLAQRESPTGGSQWMVPKHMHAPIEQQMVQLKDKAAARQLMMFMQSPVALEIIRQYGYDTPDVK